MTSKKIKTKDILGKNYYNYNLSSSNYNPSLNSTITITCIVKNVYNNTIPNKSLQLKQNGINVGNSVSTDSNGVATWTVTCSNGGLQEFSIEDNLLEVFVDNKADVNHTHNNYLTSHQDLSNYVQKSQTNGLIKNDGTIDTTNYIDDTSFSSTVGSIYSNFSNYQTKNLGSAKAYQNKNLVTDNSGNITTETKPTIPSASSTTPSADTTSGSVGTGTTWAKADHTHPKSTLYAEATHTHNNYLTSHQDISGKVNTSDLVGTFTELQELITNASSGDTIVLEKNYKNTDNKNILINKSESLTIIGNGHIIDGNKQNKYIMITGNSSVSYNIENVIFTNFTQGNAIQGDSQNNPTINGHILNIQYCTFINNKNGIWYTRNVSDKNISNCVFINHSTYAISIATPLTTINCTFINSPINSTYVTNKNYLTDHQSITGKEDSSNKVTSLSSSSTDTQYPSAKVVYDSLSNKADSSSLDTLTATVTYTDSSTDTVTFYIVPSNNNG